MFNFIIYKWLIKWKKTVHNKTPGLNNPERYVLTNNRFNSCSVLIFSDLNKAQIYKMPYKDNPHDEIEIVTSFIYLNLLTPNEHTEDYLFRKKNYENFLFEIGDEKKIFKWEKK